MMFFDEFMKIMNKYNLTILLALLFFSCQKTEKKEQGTPVFKLLEVEQTGIDFSNDLTVNLDFNIFKYMYYYNG